MEVYFRIILFILVLVVAASLGKAIKRAQEKKQPISHKRAKIVDIEKRTDEISLALLGPWVMFEIDNGDRIKLRAKAQHSLVIGDAGMLTWQGETILKFERNKPV